MAKIILACLFVAIPHVVLIILAVKAARRKRVPPRVLPETPDEVFLFSVRRYEGQ